MNSGGLIRKGTNLERGTGRKKKPRAGTHTHTHTQADRQTGSSLETQPDVKGDSAETTGTKKYRRMELADRMSLSPSRLWTRNRMTFAQSLTAMTLASNVAATF